METNHSEYLCAYDISDNKERRCVEKILKNYGFRHQLSLFICRLTRGSKEKLLHQLNDLKIETGFIMIVRMANHNNIEKIGLCTTPDLDTDYAFII